MGNGRRLSQTIVATAIAALSMARGATGAEAIDGRRASLEQVVLALSSGEGGVVLAGLEAADGAPLTLRLERARPFSSQLRVSLDGRRREVTDWLGDQVFAAGEVQEWPGSVAALRFDVARGEWKGVLLWGERAFRLTGGGGSSGSVAERTGISSLPDGERPVLEGDQDVALSLPARVASAAVLPRSSHSSVTATLAIDSDAEFFASVGSVEGALEWIGGLYSAVSEIYRRDLGMSVQIGDVLLRSSEAEDPYTPPTSGLGEDPLCKLGEWWHENRPHEQHPRAAVVLIAAGRAGSVAGRAFLTALCSPADSVSSNGCWAGGYGWAYAQGEWGHGEVLTHAHELGHLVGSQHTHCYDPPIDLCNQECYRDPIWRPEDGGSVMSYCDDSQLSLGEVGRFGDHSERVPAQMSYFLGQDLTNRKCLDGEAVYSLYAVATAGSALLRWTDRLTSDLQWLVEMRAGTSGRFKVVRKTGANGTVASVSGLKSGSTYQFRLRARQKKGYSAYSETITVEIP